MPYALHRSNLLHRNAHRYLTPTLLCAHMSSCPCSNQNAQSRHFRVHCAFRRCRTARDLAAPTAALRGQECAVCFRSIQSGAWACMWCFAPCHRVFRNNQRGVTVEAPDRYAKDRNRAATHIIMPLLQRFNNGKTVIHLDGVNTVKCFAHFISRSIPGLWSITVLLLN